MSIKAFRPSNVPEFYLENIPNPESVMNMIPFSYVISGIGANGQFFVNTFADSDFLAISLQSNNTDPVTTVIIRDLSTNWPLMIAPVNMLSIFGTASLPYFLPIPWFLIAKTTIQADVTTFAGAVKQLTFSGLRIFRR